MIKQFRAKRFFKICTFAIFMYPLTINSVSLNYSGALLYLLLLYKKKSIIFNYLYLFFLCIFGISYMLGLFLLNDFSSHMLAYPTFSFITFLVMYCLIFIKLPININDFIKSIVLISSAYSFYVTFIFLINPEFSIGNPYYVKAGIRNYVPAWPQGFSSFLIFSAFASIYLYKVYRHKIYVISTIAITFVLIITFLRATYISMIAAFIVYTLGSFIYNNRNISKFFKLSIYVFAIILLFTLIINRYRYSYAVELFLYRTIEPILSYAMGEQILDESASDRLIIWKTIWDIISQNPISLFLGSGFKGFHLFCKSYSAEICNVANSAHSQYMDILLRTGIIGLFIYIFFFIKILKFLSKYSWSLVAGFVGMLVFGLFHETFRLTHNTIMLFVLLNYSMNHRLYEK